ncbi:MAG: cytochrome c [Candidatus Eremiobacteraeota bacterium]|nr:cytochrome c [Candidatus Eremiobacteraeota bacterium]
MNRCSIALGLVLPVLLAAGCTKGSDTNSSTKTVTTTQAGASAQPAASARMASGMTVYKANCATCHGAQGAGQTGAFPPLDGNGVVTGDPKVVIRIVKLGLTGPVRMKGVMYNGQMPAWNGTLTNDQIASVLTYIRGSWSNAAGPVTAADVAAAK